ncbi:MerR family DNA-binding transcriptional regulator [Chloroflexota bacterium]
MGKIDMEKEVLHTGEVAKILQLPPRTVRKYVKKKLIPARQRYGNEGHYRYSADIIYELEKIFSSSEEPREDILEKLALQKKTAEGIERELQIDQLEHISRIQSLARSTIDSYQTDTESITGRDDYDINQGLPVLSNNAFLSGALYSLTKDALWPYLAAHLGDEGERIEHWVKKAHDGHYATEDELKMDNAEAEQLIWGGLLTIIHNPDVNEWERHGLNPTCPACRSARNTSK